MIGASKESAREVVTKCIDIALLHRRAQTQTRTYVVDALVVVVVNVTNLTPTVTHRQRQHCAAAHWLDARATCFSFARTSTSPASVLLKSVLLTNQKHWLTSFPGDHIQLHAVPCCIPASFDAIQVMVARNGVYHRLR